MPAKTATRGQRRNLSTPTSELILDEYATLPQLAAEMRKSVRHFQRQAALRQLDGLVYNGKTPLVHLPTYKEGLASRVMKAVTPRKRSRSQKEAR
jgi:hypothetical protein